VRGLLYKYRTLSTASPATDRCISSRPTANHHFYPYKPFPPPQRPTIASPIPGRHYTHVRLVDSGSGERIQCERQSGHAHDMVLSA
jgi:hypothetical protein